MCTLIKDTVIADHSLGCRGFPGSHRSCGGHHRCQTQGLAQGCMPSLEEQKKKSGSNTPRWDHSHASWILTSSSDLAHVEDLGICDKIIWPTNAPDHHVWSAAQSPWKNGLAGWLKANVDALVSITSFSPAAPVGWGLHFLDHWLSCHCLQKCGP